MNTYKKFALLGMFAIVPVVLAGCSCGTSYCEAPPPPPRPRPIPAPVVCDPCTSVLPTTTTTTFAAAPVCSTNFCELVPPGTTIYSDAPTVTVSSTGQVISSTPTRYYPTSNPRSTYNPGFTAVSTYEVPRSANVRSTI